MRASLQGSNCGMGMDRVTLLLEMFDDSWSHRCESISAALTNLTPEEAVWQHPAYLDVDPWPGMPPPGTVLWHIAHLEHSTRHYLNILRHRPVQEHPPTPPSAISELSTLQAVLEHGLDDLRGCIAEMDDSDLDKPCFSDMDVAEFLRMIIRHHTWHAGQIVVARRLYRFREGP